MNVSKEVDLLSGVSGQHQQRNDPYQLLMEYSIPWTYSIPLPI